jgi:hypothetical protein
MDDCALLPKGEVIMTYLHLPSIHPDRSRKSAETFKIIDAQAVIVSNQVHFETYGLFSCNAMYLGESLTFRSIAQIFIVEEDVKKNQQKMV